MKLKVLSIKVIIKDKGKTIPQSLALPKPAV